MMKCSYCHAEIPQGEVFCPNCLTEVQLVPDFEDHYSLGNARKDTIKDREKARIYRKKRRTGILFETACFLALAGIFVITGLLLYFTNSPKVRGDRGREPRDAERQIIAPTSGPEGRLALESLEISPVSGVYYEDAARITVTVPEGFTAYYIFDGTPDETSILYRSPVDMPEGKHIFSVVAYNGAGEHTMTESRTFDVRMRG